MSDTDSFIREVTEEVRQDRMLRYWKAYGPFIIGGITLIVAIAAGLAYWDTLQQKQAAENGGFLLQAQDAEAGTVGAIVNEVAGPAQVIAIMRSAQAQAAAGERAAAADVYDSVADDQAQPERYRALARLEAIRLRASLGEPAAMLPALDELAMPGALYRPLALELRATLRLNAGDVAGARADLATILTEPASTGESRARASALIETLPPSGTVSAADGEVSQ
ncbi:MAG: tetratricopeptide repeat protein [Pseudomonadota bacterium]